jgi:hypothetical protein
VRKGIDYRKRLLAAVDAVLTHTPEGSKRARRIVSECDRSLRNWTLNSLVWDPLVSELRDSSYFTNDEFLLELRESLRGPVWEAQRVYIHLFSGAEAPA